MSKYLVVGDCHYRARGSIYRIDDYYATQMDKLKQILDIGAQQDVEGIFLLGDVTHTIREPYQLVYDLIEVMKTSKIPLYTIIGNHDVTGRNMESIRSSPLGVLIKSGALTLLREDTEFPDKTVMRGIDYRSDHAIDQYIFGAKYDQYLKIAYSHNMVAPFDKAPFDFIHPETVKTDSNIIFLGHLHSPFDYISSTQIQKPRWINPGVPFRWTVNEASIVPKVALLNVSYVEGIHSYNVQYIPLKAKPGSEVLDLNKAKEVKEHSHCIDSFIDTLESTTFGSTNLEESITQYSKDQGLDVKVVQELLRRVRQSRGSYGIN